MWIKRIVLSTLTGIYMNFRLRFISFHILGNYFSLLVLKRLISPV